jgi:hypothetical protein
MYFLTIFLGMMTSFAFTLNAPFLMNQRTQTLPTSIPVAMNTKGEVLLFGQNSGDNLRFLPSGTMGLSRFHFDYSHPVSTNNFNFYPVQQELGWVEVKKLKIEAGLGLANILKTGVEVGLIPYKGSNQVFTRFKDSKKEKSYPFKMPKTFDDLRSWKVGDEGTFETYGGIEAYLGLSVSFFELAMVSFGLQNQFILEIKRVSPHIVSLKIGEEDLRRRQLKLGPFAANEILAKFSGKRFFIDFTLDLDEPGHHELFAQALKGNLKLLQERLSQNLQKLNWQGSDKQFFYGIPGVVGRSSSQSHYEMEQDGLETDVSVLSKKLKGSFTPIRNYENFVYETSESFLLIWTAEMEKVSPLVLDYGFYLKGRSMGVRGFDEKLPTLKKMGTMISQIGIHVTRSEAEVARKVDLSLVARYLKMKCYDEQLYCRNDQYRAWVMNEFEKHTLKPWEEMRGDLGQLLLKEPALIYAVVKTLGIEKKVYFKLLSGSFQSLEGSDVIEL